MVRDVCNCYFSFWTIFCPFTTLTAQKINISIKTKHLEVSRFWTNVPKIMIICYTVPEIYGVWRMELLFFIFGYFLPFDPPNSPKKKFTKMEKTTTTTTPNWRYHHFTQGTKKHDHMLYCSWDIWCVTDVIVIFHFGLYFAFLPP